MYNFTQKYFDFLIKREGFVMESYRSFIRNEDIWIAIKRFPEGLYVIFITDEKYEEIDSKEVVDFLKFKGEPYSLHKIVLADNDYIHLNDDFIPKVVFDVSKNRAIYCDSGCEAISKIALEINRQRSVQGNRQRIGYGKDNIVTLSIIGINVLLYIISAFISRNIMDIHPYVLLEMGAKFGPLIDRGEVWRLVTCAFLHGGIVHLLLNMYALYSIGSQIEIIYGKVKYLIIYFLSAIGSSLLSYFISPYTISIGASGAIFGLLGALVVYAIKERDRLQQGVIPNLLFVIGLNIYIGVTLPNIDNYGHFGGLAVGAISSVIMLMVNKTPNHK